MGVGSSRLDIELLSSESVEGLIGGGVKRTALRPGLEEGFILRKRIRMIGMDPLLWATQFYKQL